MNTSAVAVHVLDTKQLGRAQIIAATALETAEGIALFDTGPESTFDNVVAELQRVGATAQDVRHVFLSHIHFDHAGAAWRFAELGATVYVHRRGARHLSDPTKLVESATRIFGSEMERLWGRFAPVAESHLRVLEDGDVVRLGEIEVRAIETPGHASHHHVYHWDDILFGGDVAGVRIGGGPPIPPFVPPELDVEEWERSIAKMRTLDAAQLYLPHFGRVTAPVSEHLDALQERVRRYANWFRDHMRAGKSDEHLIPAFAEFEAQDLRAGGASADEVIDYESADPSYMAVTAATRYWRKNYPEQVGAVSP